jgi:nitrogen fixation protein
VPIRLWIAVLVGWWLNGPDLCAAEETPRPTDSVTPAPIEVHHWYVPQRFLPQVTKGHVPVSKDEFNELLAALRPATLPLTPIDAAVYRARFDDGQLIDGRIECRLASDRQTGTPQSQHLWLDGCNLPLKLSPIQEGVRLGVAANGRGLVAYEPASELRLHWTLASNRSHAATAQFDFIGLDSAFNEIVIEIPNGFRLESTHGIVSSRAIDAKLTQWTVSLGGRRATKLEVIPENESQDVSAIIAERQVTRHIIASQGSEIVSELTLESAEPFQRIQLTANEGVQLTRVLFDEKEVPFTMREESGVSAAAASPDRDYEIQLPTPANRGVLNIFAQTDAPMNGPLPKVLPTNVFWRNRRIEAVVPDHIELTDLSMDGCRWLSRSRDASTKTRNLQWQVIASPGDVSFKTKAAAARINCESYTQVVFAADKTRGLAIQSLSGTSGLTYEMEGIVNELWNVDSITSEPPGALDDWSIVSKGNAKILQLRFTTPISVDHQVTLQVEASSPAVGLGLGLDGDLANLLTLQDARIARQFRAFAAEAPLRFVVENDDAVTPIDATELTTAVAQHPQFLESDYAYDGTRSHDVPVFRLQRGNVPWSAGIGVNNFLSEATCYESWTVECLAESDGLEEVSVRIAPSAPSVARWYADAQRTIPLQVTRMVRAAQEADSAELHDTYRVVLPESLGSASSGGNKVIYGVRTRPLIRDESGRLPPIELTVVTAPAAKSHGAILSIEGDEIISERVSGIRSSLDAIGIAPSLERNRITLAAFRYDANTDFKLPSIQFTDSAKEHDSERMASAWIDRGIISTRVAASGQRWHELTLTIQNRGLRSLQIELPEDVAVQRTTISGQASTNSPGEFTNDIVIPLNVSRESLTAKIEFTDATTALAPFATLQKPHWGASVPVYSDDWYLELPRRFSTFPAMETAMGGMGRRLFGPFGKNVRDTKPARQRKYFVASPRIAVFSTRLLQAFAWVLFLLITGLAWLNRLPRRWQFLTAGSGLAIAAAAPTPFFVLGTATFWGVLLGFSLRWFPDHTKVSTAAAALPSPRYQALGIILIVCFACHTCAEEPSADDADHLHVIVAIDDDKEPAPNDDATVVYVPKKQYEELFVKAKRQTGAHEFVVERVTYRVKLERDAQSLPVVASNVVAEFDIRTPRLTGPIEIPVGANADDRLSQLPTWDGAAFEPRWNEAGDHLIVQQESGVHKLRLNLSPMRGSRQNWLGLQLPIQPHPSARLIVDQTVDEALDIRVASALGATSIHPINGQVISDLGSADMIDVRWRKKNVRDLNEVHQYLHLAISSGLLRLRTHVTSAKEGTPLRRQTFRVPPRIKWQVPKNSVAATRALGNGFTELSVEWDADEPVKGDVEFLMQDSLDDNDATIRIPQLTNCTLVDRFLAIQMDKIHTLVHEAGEAPLGLDAFHATWPAAPKADALRILANDQSEYSVSVRARSSQQAADEASAVEFGQESVMIRYLADVVPMEGQTFQHTLQVPQKLEIERVSISTGQRVYWTRGSDGTVQIRPDQPISGPHELLVETRLRPQEEIEYVLPLIQLQSAVVNRTSITIHRDDDVELQVTDLGSFSPLAESPTGFVAVDSKPIAVLESKGKDRIAPTIRISPNSATLNANMLTTMQTVGAEWFARVDFAASAQNGTFDSISFELPDTWGESLTMEPELKWEIQRLPDRRRRLRVWVPIGREQPQAFSMTAAVDTAQGVRLPRVRPLLTNELTSWVALPKAIEDRNLEWATRRLVRQSLPRELAHSTPRGQCDTYRAIGRLATATLRTTNRQNTHPNILTTFVDTTLHHESIQQSFRYFIQPHGQGTLAVELPAKMQLISASAVGRAAHLTKRQGNVWQLEHLPTNLPYRLKIQCFTPREATTQRLELHCPAIVGCDSKQMVWSVQSDKGRLRAVSASQPSLGPQTWQLRKWNTMADLVNLPAETASSATRAELEEWNRLWLAHVAEEFEIPRNDAVALSSPEKLLARIRTGIMKEEPRNAKKDNSSIFTTADDQTSILVRQLTPQRRSPYRCTFALLAIMLPLWLSQSQVWEQVTRHAHRWLPAMVVAGGFVWSNWLVPAWIGPLLVLLGLAFSLTTLLPKKYR